MNLATYKMQKGAALLISMVILMALTAIGISAMSNSRMQSDMALNQQLGITESQFAETGIEDIIFHASPGPTGNKLEHVLADDVIHNIDPTQGSTGPKSLAAADLDPKNVLKYPGVKVDIVVTLAQVANVMCPGGAGTGDCGFYTIESTPFLDGTTPGGAHYQGVIGLLPTQH